MAYTRPMVMVFQEYADTSTTTPSASLPPCIIGPCYHIVDAVEDEGNSLYGHYTEAGIENGFFPNNAPGALIDEKSVSFRLKNARVRLYADLAAARAARETASCSMKATRRASLSATSSGSRTRPRPILRRRSGRNTVSPRSTTSPKRCS